MLLRTGMTQTGAEAAGQIQRLVRQIRRHWSTTHHPRVLNWLLPDTTDRDAGAGPALKPAPEIIGGAGMAGTGR
jgi:hypothetical protein